MVVRGDDFTFAGTEVEVKETQSKMHDTMSGCAEQWEDDQQTIEILERTLRWTDDRVEYE